MTTRTLRVFAIYAGVAAACAADPAPEDDQDELQALLQDAALPALGSAAPRAVPAIAQPPRLLPGRMWRFDDCSPDRAELFNAGSGELAFRSVGVTCAPGILGSAVELAAREDIVYVPDEPYFTFGGGVSVAAWLRPEATDRTQTLFRKRDKGTSAFALVLHRGRFRFVINLGGGRAASVTAPSPARAGVFQHVAGSYDGSALRLYVDGQQVAMRSVAGSIPPGPGPLLIGNDGSERRFDGVIDDAVFELRAMPAEQIQLLNCLPNEPTVAVAPQTSAPTAPDTATMFDVAITNHNPPVCPAMTFGLRVSASDILRLDPVDQTSAPVASGETVHLTFSATPYDVAGPLEVLVDVSASDWLFFSSSSVVVTTADPVGCHASKSRELMIVHPSVIQDPERSQGAGAWSFQHLVEEAAPTAGDAPAMVEDTIRSFLAPQVINGFTVEPRPGWSTVLADWPRTASGALDLGRGPFRLLAIVNRIDLRDLDRGNAGKLNFVFGVVEHGFPLSATVMFEYELPAASEADVLGWAQAFHALGALAPSPEYNAALQAITDRVVARGVRTGGVNGSALHVVRSNEFSFGGPFNQDFELREFALSPETGRLAPVPLAQTPDNSLNFSFTLGDFINANRDAILAGTHVVPDALDGQPFRAGSVLNGSVEIWNPFGVDPEARQAFAFHTCNGCHSVDETGTFFQHVEAPGFGSGLSPFLTGVTVLDPVTQAPRSYNDMLRRRRDLEAIVCPPTPLVSLRKGISRVH